ncbi:MAG: hypothetical protein OXU20_29870 [Myxococcales bacterium]|nr:hypothetical protein [Myxococcales bacterium]MDD9967425.1 hypothetical protein [Myxococcales bacterium]
METLRAYLLGGLFVAATAYPAFLPPGEDSYPLSTYPMFSRDRGKRSWVGSALALDRQGTELPLAPSYVANSEAMQAVKTLNTALNRGRKAARKLCAAIALRVRERADPQLASAVVVQLQRQRVDSVAFLAGHRDARGRKVFARCPIPGRKAP